MRPSSALALHLCLLGSLTCLFPVDAAGQAPATSRVHVVGATVAHLELLGAEDADYLGVTVDRIGDRFGFSGSYLFGRGAGDGTWVHLPLAGIVAGVAISLPFALLDRLLGGSDPDDAFDYDQDESLIPSFVFEMLLYENVHRHFRLGDRVLLSPYVAVLGLDGRTSDFDSFVSFNSGVGVGARLFATDRFVVAPDVSFRHHWVDGAPSAYEGTRWGYTVSLRAGIAF